MIQQDSISSSLSRLLSSLMAELGRCVDGFGCREMRLERLLPPCALFSACVGPLESEDVCEEEQEDRKAT